MEISEYTQDLGGNSTLFIAHDIMEFCSFYVYMEAFNIFLLWRILTTSFMRFYSVYAQIFCTTDKCLIIWPVEI